MRARSRTGSARAVERTSVVSRGIGRSISMRGSDAVLALAASFQGLAMHRSVWLRCVPDGAGSS